MKNINAYFYPTPEELGRQAAALTVAEEVRKAFAETFGFPLEDISIERDDDPDFEDFVTEDEDFISDGEFLWTTQKGETYRLSDMATQHIFYSLRMLFNHVVPPVFRVGKFKRYPDVLGWDEDYKIDALAALREELESRGDLEEELRYEFEDIQQNAAAIVTLGL